MFYEPAKYFTLHACHTIAYVQMDKHFTSSEPKLCGGQGSSGDTNGKEFADKTASYIGITTKWAC